MENQNQKPDSGSVTPPQPPGSPAQMPKPLLGSSSSSEPTEQPKNSQELLNQLEEANQGRPEIVSHPEPFIKKAPLAAAPKSTVPKPAPQPLTPPKLPPKLPTPPTPLQPVPPPSPPKPVPPPVKPVPPKLPTPPPAPKSAPIINPPTPAAPAAPKPLSPRPTPQPTAPPMAKPPVPPPKAIPKSAPKPPAALQAQPVSPPQPAPKSAPLPKLHHERQLPKLPRLHFHIWLRNRGRLFMPLLIVAVGFLLLAAPASRYPLFGIFVRHNYSVRIIDSETNQPVSNAEVSAGSTKFTSDGNGFVHLAGLSAGYHQLVVQKNNFDGVSAKLLVPILNQKSIPALTLHTTGVLVDVKFVNKITNQPLPNASLSSGDLSAIGDSGGQALVSLDSATTAAQTTVKMPGFNDLSFQLRGDATKLLSATAQLVPSGQVYYLSKTTSGVNIVKSNFDGSNRSVLLAASGYETNQTQLMKSPDNSYLALLARRTPDPLPQLYVLNTATGKMSEVAFGPGIKMMGWLGDTVYWQVGGALKSYTPATQATANLSGSAANSANQQLTSNAAQNSKTVFAGFSVIDKYNEHYLLLKRNGFLYIGSVDGNGTPLKTGPVL